MRVQTASRGVHCAPLPEVRCGLRAADGRPYRGCGDGRTAESRSYGQFHLYTLFGRKDAFETLPSGLYCQPLFSLNVFIVYSTDDVCPFGVKEDEAGVSADNHHNRFSFLGRIVPIALL